MAKLMRNDVPMGGALYYTWSDTDVGDGLSLYASCKPTSRPTAVPLTAPLRSSSQKERKLLHD